MMENKGRNLVAVDDGTRKMTESKAFWHAVATVGSALLIVCAPALYFLRSDLEVWLIFLLFMLVPALLLLPLIYHNYMKGPSRRRFSRRQHLVFAILFGALAIAYLGTKIHHSTRGWEAVSTWAIGGGWLLIAIDHLRRYLKTADETALTTQ
jgi:hypothetical protein